MTDVTRKNQEMWLKDLEDTLKNAKDLRDAGFYDVATLYIQLAVEKALKAAIATFKGEEPPKDHNLARLYFRITDKVNLSDEEVLFLRKLTGAAYGTRYLDVNLKLPREIYTKDVADKYMKEALVIIERVKTSMKT